MHIILTLAEKYYSPAVEDVVIDSFEIPLGYNAVTLSTHPELVARQRAAQQRNKGKKVTAWACLG